LVRLADAAAAWDTRRGALVEWSADLEVQADAIAKGAQLVTDGLPAVVEAVKLVFGDPSTC
jgi:hypothetical protein